MGASQQFYHSKLQTERELEINRFRRRLESDLTMERVSELPVLVYHERLFEQNEGVRCKSAKNSREGIA